MNLADAIRKATLGGHTTFEALDQPVNRAVSAPIAPSTAVHEQSAKQRAAKPMENTMDEQPRTATPASDEHTGAGTVKLELTLTHEQMDAVLRVVIDGHRNVLTLREAASYLRMHGAELQALAESGQVPAFLLEGKWRFPKPALDEWVTAQTYKQGSKANVA